METHNNKKAVEKTNEDWVAISQTCPLTREFLDTNSLNVNWKVVSDRKDLNEEFVRTYLAWLDINRVIAHTQLSIKFFNDWLESTADPSDIHWSDVFMYQKLDDQSLVSLMKNRTVRKLCHRSEMYHALSNNQYLSEDFINKYAWHLNWYLLSFSALKHVSESFIIHHIHYVDFYSLSRSGKQLSENFITTYRKKLDWEWISTLQTLTPAFIDKNKKLIHFDCLPKEELLSLYHYNKD